MSRDLSLFIPHRGRPKISLGIPESFDLYLCPPACVRRVSIRAIRNDARQHMGFLYMSEADLATGAYEQRLFEAVDDVLASLDKPPRAFFIHLNCVDDFLGTDEDAMLAKLRERFPATGFATMHMNPIAADKGLSTGLRIHERLYSMLEPIEPASERDNAVNLIGNFASLEHDCELPRVLEAWGIDKVRQLFACATFEEYQALAKSRLNMVLADIGSYAAECMEKRLDIPQLSAPVDYELANIEACYLALGKALGAIPPERASLEALRCGSREPQDLAEAIMAQAKNRAQSAVERARERLGNRAVIVDSSAAMRPFALAKALMGYGFNVRAVFALHEKPEDAETRDWVLENAPHISVVRSESYDDIMGLELPRNAVCVGFDCAYLLKAPHFVALQKDEGLFGYQAVWRLMDLMADSLASVAEWEG